MYKTSLSIPRIVQNELFCFRRYIYRPKKNSASRAIQGALLTLKNLENMYTQEQLDKLQLKLNELKIAKNRFKGLQSISWLRIDFGYREDSCKCSGLPISSNTTKKILELLLAEYTSRVKTLQDEIDNTIIINPSKL